MRRVTLPVTRMVLGCIELEEEAGRAFAFIAPEVETRVVDIVPASSLPAS